MARRVAARARRDEARRRKHERSRAEMTARQTEAPAVSDACVEVYEEIDALPVIYRSAVALCYLEGLSHEQAAKWLGCPRRTFQSRLLRAKERLRDRLARRGASLPAVLPPLANSLFPSTAWVKTTAEAARAFAAGQPWFATAGVSAATIALARSSLWTAVHVRRLVAGALLTVGLAVLAVAIARGGFAADPPRSPLKASTPVVVAQAEKDPNNRGYGPFFEPGGAAIPREHTIEMERGVTIGGTVKARDGKAIAGATVIIIARAGADGSANWSYVPEVKVTTDSGGRWRYNEMPTGWSFCVHQGYPSRLRTYLHATRFLEAERFPAQGQEGRDDP
ncbi:MAG: sigma factor-like helix-turn-helix DNA-binding protein [Isosphaeraceae bacterium]